MVSLCTEMSLFQGVFNTEAPYFFTAEDTNHFNIFAELTFLIGSSNRSGLYCNSRNFLDSTINATSFCVISGSYKLEIDYKSSYIRSSNSLSMQMIIIVKIMLKSYIVNQQAESTIRMLT